MKDTFEWKCIVCEKVMEIINSGSMSPGFFPNIDGGTIIMDFGYGSKFDQINSQSEIHSCICDKCFEKKRHLTREVECTIIKQWKLIDDPNSA